MCRRQETNCALYWRQCTSYTGYAAYKYSLAPEQFYLGNPRGVTKWVREARLLSKFLQKIISILMFQLFSRSLCCFIGNRKKLCSGVIVLVELQRPGRPTLRFQINKQAQMNKQGRTFREMSRVEDFLQSCLIKQGTLVKNSRKTVPNKQVVKVGVPILINDQA